MTPIRRIENAIIQRRSFLKILGLGGVTAMLPHLGGAQQKPVPDSPEAAHFVFTRIQYDKGDWNTDTRTEGLQNGSEVNLLYRLNRDSNLFAYEKQEHILRADDDRIFDNPFLYITGHGDVELTQTARDNIKRIVENGGFLLADNCSGAKNVGFDRAFKNQLTMMFPENHLEPIPMTHAMFQSPHRIERVLGGDKRIDPYLEGMALNGRVAVVYTNNDLGCAWEGHECRPGGEAQRTHAFEMGANLVYYALSGF
jgi:hypothetical protein